MKFTFAIVALGMVFFLISFAAAREIGFIETFGLSRNRDGALRQLIPGTGDYYYYHCLNAQHKGDFKQVMSLLELWIKREGYTEPVREILNRQALLEYEQNPDKTLDYIRQELNLRFDHQKEIAGQKSDYPTVLDPEQISISRLTSQAFSRYKNLQGIEDAGLDILLYEQLDPDRRRDLLQRLQRPDIPNLAKLVSDDLRYRHSGGFGSFPIHRQLLKSQLDECLRLMPELADNAAFIETYIIKLAPSDDSDIRYDIEEKKVYLERLRAFSKELAPAHNSLKAHILYQLLELNRTQGNYNHDLFMEYIKLPRNVTYIHPDYISRKELRLVIADLNADFSKTTRLPNVGTDEELVRDYLSHFLAQAKDYTAYVHFIRDDFLKTVFAETKILNSIGDMEQWYSLMNPNQYQALKERVDIDFVPANRQFFTSDEPVRLDLYVKNTDALIVKVFELNTFNCYQADLREIDTAISLDGLTATWEEVINYEEPPLRRVLRTFDFPQIDKPGVFVIEFIGNGKSSRALIRKGRLYVTEKIGAAGHEFTVRNEKNEKCPDASIWMSGREYKPGKDSVIIVPFTNTPGKQTLILKNRNFCALASFEHLSEGYELSAGFYVDRESLIKGSKAKCLVRPVLRLNGHPVSLSLLENVRLEISSRDHDGVSAAKEIPGFELSEDKESLYEFQVPDNSAMISFALKAQIQNMSQNRKQDLNTHEIFQINGTDRTPNVSDIFLSHSDGSYFLEVLGKNGEIRSDTAVNIELKHRCFRDTVSVPLQSDDKGRIRLGRLKDIAYIRTADKNSRQWRIFGDQCRYPANIHAPSHEVIRIPYLADSQGEARLHYVLLEKRGQSYAADRSDAVRIRGGFFEISGLAPGDYELFLKDSDLKISISLTDGKAEEGFVISENRILETKNGHPLQITDIQINDSSVTVMLENFSESTRVHVFGTRFIPEFPLFSHFDCSALPEPYRMRLTRAESRYVAGRNIGDEYRYILERRYAEKFPGNMLNRPELLLNPWNIRKTETAVDEAAAGEEYRAMAPPAPARKEMADAFDSLMSLAESGDLGFFFSNYDFLAQPSAAAVNLRPDENGKIKIERNAFGPYQQLHFLALDLSDTVYREVSLPEAETKTRDLRLSRNFDAERHLTEQKLISLIPPAETFRIENIATSEFEVCDSLNTAYQLLSTLSPDETLKEFAFILRWPEMSDAEKQEKYSEYACHELSFFLYHKDRAFFDAVILPYLRNKKDKTFLDKRLLGDDLGEYLNPWAFSQLNIAEKILLTRGNPKDKDRTARYVKDLSDMIPPNTDEYNRLFDTALKGRAFAPIIPASVIAEPGYMLNDILSLKSVEADSDIDKGTSAEFAPRAKAAENIKMKRMALSSRRDERKAVRQFFQKPDKTEEWAENNYYKLPAEEQNSERITVNAFWNDYAQSEPGQIFLSKHFFYAHRNFSEIMLALAVLDLPFKAGKHETKTDSSVFSLRADSPVIVFHKEIRESGPASDNIPVMISQHFFDPDDRYDHRDNERFDKYMDEEFLFRKAYGCQVVVSNPASAPCKLNVLLQIPCGAMPLNTGFYTKSIPLYLEPYETERFEYSFYFPETGIFQHYPAQIAKNGQFLAAASVSELKVVAELSKTDTASWDYISQNGSEEEVAEFLRTRNLNRIDLEKIAFRMKKKDFFETVISLLEQRFSYHHTLWSYGIYHHDSGRISEYLRHSPFADRCGTFIRTALLTVDPLERKSYQHLEYKPLVNARAHRLGKDQKILNDRFYEQYERFMKYLSYRPAFDNDDLMAVTCYLLLQDRISEAVFFFGQIDADKLQTRIQYDYLQTYLDFYTENLGRSRNIAAKYLNCLVPRWQKLFRHVTAQLDELEGKSAEITDKESRDQVQTRLAATEPGFDFRIESGQIKITYQNLNTCRVSYYPMDIELLFSRNPFIQQQSGHFDFIRPNETAEIALPPDRAGGFTFEIPGKFHHSNLMVEIEARGMKKSQAYYSNALDVQIIETYGQVKTENQNTHKPLAKVYVKVYARMKGGDIRFYKDGYTDLRGRFDYVSLNTDELDKVEKFAILLLSEEYGAVIREASPPKR